jgi:hypothetical protein
VSGVETDFLLISEAVARLEAGMFGGAIKRPEPVEAIKKIHPQLSVGLGLHKEKAASAIHAAILKGSLGVHVYTRPTAEGVSHTLHLPIDVLTRLLKVRGGLPDHAIRPPVSLFRDTCVTPELFAALSSSALYMHRSEFKAWYEKQKSRHRWPSQRASTQPRTGRPPKQTDELLTSIRARVAENTWSAPDGIAKLVRLLATHGAPNRNLVRRAVQRLYEETGENQYRIVPRKRVEAKTACSQT